MPQPAPPPLNCNASVYTMHTIDDEEEQDDRSALLSPATPNYGATVPRSPGVPSSARIIFNATLKMAVLFIVSTLILGGTLYFALPTLEDADRPLLRLPKSFQQLKDLNYLLKKYRDIYPARVFVCYTTTYLFLQAFSLPGSMYLSILGGAVYGVPIALPLVCTLVATGATLCYLISAALGPALLAIPSWARTLSRWSSKISTQSRKGNLISFLIVLRIMPLPPHWVVNVVCPHVGVGLGTFWISTAMGILGVSVIHTTIGGGLDEMTGAEDFHLISWKNALGLGAVVVGAMIPVGLRYWFRGEVESVSEEIREEQENEEDEDVVLESGPPVSAAQKRKLAERQGLLAVDPYSDEESDDGDEDLILEAGPSIDTNNKPTTD